MCSQERPRLPVSARAPPSEPYGHGAGEGYRCLRLRRRAAPLSGSRRGATHQSRAGVGQRYGTRTHGSADTRSRCEETRRSTGALDVRPRGLCLEGQETSVEAALNRVVPARLQGAPRARIALVRGGRRRALGTATGLEEFDDHPAKWGNAMPSRVPTTPPARTGTRSAV